MFSGFEARVIDIILGGFFGHPKNQIFGDQSVFCRQKSFLEIRVIFTAQTDFFGDQNEFWHQGFEKSRKRIIFIFSKLVNVTFQVFFADRVPGAPKPEDV